MLDRSTDGPRPALGGTCHSGPHDELDLGADHRHCEPAADALAAADRPERLLTRRVPMDKAAEALDGRAEDNLDGRPEDNRVVLEVAA